MVSPIHPLAAPKTGDFLVDNQYSLEIGGIPKKYQKKFTDNTWIVKDGMEVGINKVIQLCVFGFLF
jgi:hypothetical protein